MAKNFIVVAFVSTFLGAIFVFLQRGERRAMRPMTEDGSPDKRSRITVEDFVLYEYKGHQATGTFQGKLAQFQDPDALEIFGNVRGSRLQNGHKETVAAESATLHFNSKGLSELVKNSSLQTVELENQVRFGTDDITLLTDFALYDETTGKLTSDRQVRIQSPQADMVGSKGFEFDSKTQDVKVFGPLEGTLVDVKKKP